MEYLDDQQRQQIYDDGYTLVRGAVPPEKVTAALRAINASLGERGIDPQQLTTFRSQTYCPEITGSEAIVSLLVDTPLWSMAESVIGEGTLQPVTHGQIALRFPTTGSATEIHPHIDGMYTPHNGVKKDDREFHRPGRCLPLGHADRRRRQFHGMAGNAPNVCGLLRRGRTDGAP
jgi:hypothetical protein